MKKIYLLLLVTFITVSSTFALTPLTDWVRSISGGAAISHDAVGNAYVTGSFSGYETNLDLSVAAPGVYFVELIQNGNVTQKKLVKE